MKIQDMEHTIATGQDRMHLDYTKDVMELMTGSAGTGR